MKKALLILLVGTFALLGTAAAQTALDDVSHDVTVDIPSMAFIRFVNAGSPLPGTVGPDGVEFTLTETNFGPGTFAPSNADPFNWDDIEVYYNGTSAWSVTVETTGDGGFAWNKIAMTPSVADAYTLATSGQIYERTSSFKTGDWFSLGIDPENYELTLDGSEDAGSFSATVQFTLVNP